MMIQDDQQTSDKQNTRDNSAAIAAKVKDLPPLPVTIQKLLGVVGDSGCSVHKVTEVLKGDQALTSKILRLVNSSFYGMSRQITTVERGAVILGNSAIRNLAIGVGTSSTLKKLKGPIDWTKFWEHTISTAVLSKHLAIKLHYVEKEEAFVAGLLHDIGHLVCYCALADSYSHAILKCKTDLCDTEKRIFGATHCEVGAQLLDYWKLPQNLCHAVKQHHSYRMMKSGKIDLAAIVALADAMACMHGHTFADKIGDTEFKFLCKNFHIVATWHKELLAEAEDEIEQTRKFFLED